MHNCEAELRAFVSSEGLQGSVHFAGDVRNVHEYLQASDIFVFPTESDAFPLALVEAMACGLPVVVSNVASLPEVVGDAGLLVDPHDVDELTVAMWRILKDDDLRREMREKGLRQAARFSWERAARETLEIYRRVSEK